METNSKTTAPDKSTGERKATILVVDDSPTQVQRLKHVLEKNDFRTLDASNGKEALDILSQELPTIIISDIIMPETDGYELCGMIKSDQRYKDIPVILLTSLTDTKDVLKALECGANSFIVKPFEEEYLLSRITYFLAELDGHKIEPRGMGLEIYFEGQKYFITSDRIQILDLLLSTYESAVQRNLELIRTQEELRKLNEDLETKVEERTAQLTEKILERKHMEEELRQAQKMEAIGQLAGGVAHDFNNILMAIGGYTELTLLRLPQNDPLRTDLMEIQKATQQGASLTRQLLAFSRKQVLEPKILDLNKVLKNTENMMRRLLGEHVQIQTVFEENLGRVKADPGQIEQIILNLSVNARDAMPEGGHLIIETTNAHLDDSYARSHLSVAPGEYVTMSVSDTGVGMDESVRSRIFEPFFTTKEKGKGTGLGLSTVYGIVQQTEGHITVYSEPGKGTIFKIYLPRIDVPTENTKSLPSETELFGKETILLVDDNDAIRKAISSFLEARGYHVLNATDGTQALDIIGKFHDPVHLVITDMVMPQMSGPELSDRLRSERPDLRVLFMSGYSEAAIQHDVTGDRSAFLQKPAPMQTLLRKIRELLAKP